MVKKIGITVVLVSSFMFSIGIANTFAKPCACPKEVKCAGGCTSGKTEPCGCRH